MANERSFRERLGDVVMNWLESENVSITNKANTPIPVTEDEYQCILNRLSKAEIDVIVKRSTFDLLREQSQQIVNERKKRQSSLWSEMHSYHFARSSREAYEARQCAWNELENSRHELYSALEDYFATKCKTKGDK